MKQKGEQSNFTANKINKKPSSTKEKVLAMLEANGNRYISGQEIADSVYVTRAAVWKAIKTLQADGYDVEAITNRGYKLINKETGLSKEKILKFIDERIEESRFVKTGYSCEIIDFLNLISGNIEVFDEVDSTNNIAAKYADANYGKPAVIVAKSQTAGRGRRGRNYYSPKDTGIYISFVIYPNSDFTKATEITCKTACAVCRAIEDVLKDNDSETSNTHSGIGTKNRETSNKYNGIGYKNSGIDNKNTDIDNKDSSDGKTIDKTQGKNIDVKIKWVNDIFVNDRKVAGILTEGITSMEDGALSHVIVGIGINVFEPTDGFPKEIKKTAGALLKSSEDKDILNKLTAALIIRMAECQQYSYENETDNEGAIFVGNDYLTEYRRRSILIGNYVKIMRPGQPLTKGNEYAYVTGISDKYHLMVKYEDGHEEELSTGEVSVVKY